MVRGEASIYLAREFIRIGWLDARICQVAPQLND